MEDLYLCSSQSARYEESLNIQKISDISNKTVKSHPGCTYLNLTNEAAKTVSELYETGL